MGLSTKYVCVIFDPPLSVHIWLDPSKAPNNLDPQARAVSRIRRRIFVRRKSAEKVRLAEYAIRRQVVFT